MRVFVAGASGAIGQPLIKELVRQGHTVTGMTRSEAGAQKLVDLGATVAIVSAFDGAAVEDALRRSAFVATEAREVRLFFFSVSSRRFLLLGFSLPDWSRL